MKVQVLVGMIASGKSTWARERAKRGAIIINDDALVLAVHAGDYLLYDKTLKPIYKTMENTLFGLAVSHGRDVVVDRGVNISREARRRWIALAGSYDVPCEAVVFPHNGAYVHAERRHRSDARAYTLEAWLAVAKEHDARYHVPTVAEGFAAVEYVEQQGGVQCGRR